MKGVPLLVKSGVFNGKVFDLGVGHSGNLGTHHFSRVLRKELSSTQCQFCSKFLYLIYSNQRSLQTKSLQKQRKLCVGSRQVVYL